MAIAWSCSKKEDSIPATTVPSVTTTEANTITTTTAKSGGNVVDNGGAAVTERGIYWGDMTDPGPSNGGIKIDGGTGTGSFISSITGLTEATTYHVRAYAKNSVGTGFGADLTFITQTTGSPQVSTKALSAKTSTGVTSGGIVSDPGGPGLFIVSVGLVWSTNPVPTQANGTEVPTSGSSNFNASITSLTPEVTIYIRAFATNSGNKIGYGEILSYTPPPATITYHGQTYNTVQIGDQLWLKENLTTTTYRNGDLIPIGLNDFDNMNTTNGTYSIYLDDQANNTTYGKLYNWYAITDSRKLCPVGWHVPSDDEWTTLENYLGGSLQAGGKMKTITGWTSPNNGATNESGFSGLPGGYRYGGYTMLSEYDKLGSQGNWWSTTVDSDAKLIVRQLNSNTSNVSKYLEFYKTSSYSVRCLRD